MAKKEAPNIEFKIQLKGMEKVIEKIQELKADLPPAMAGALHFYATQVVKHSQDNYVPVLTGALRDSGFARIIKETEEEQEVEGGFGGYSHGKDVDYAVWVHERLDVKHEVGTAKYLEKALKDYEDKFEEVAGDYLKKHWGGK